MSLTMAARAGTRDETQKLTSWKRPPSSGGDTAPCCTMVGMGVGVAEKAWGRARGGATRVDDAPAAMQTSADRARYE